MKLWRVSRRTFHDEDGTLLVFQPRTVKGREWKGKFRIGSRGVEPVKKVYDMRYNGEFLERNIKDLSRRTLRGIFNRHDFQVIKWR